MGRARRGDPALAVEVVEPASVAPTSSRRVGRLRGSLAARLAVAIALAIVIIAYLASDVVLSPTDAYVYLAAGERLNAGHDLYAISPGDRVIGLNPPFWTVPTLSPPLLGVLWRPLAALGVAGMFVGWALASLAYLFTLTTLVRAAPLAGIVTVAILAPFIGVQVGLGNVNGFLALGMLGLWVFRDRPWVIGGILALMVSVKVTPIILVLWLIATGRYRAVGATFAWMVVFALVSLAGAGLDAHIEYVGVITHTVSEGTSATSVAGALRAIGMDPGVARFGPWILLGVGSVLVVLLRSRPGWSFVIAVALVVAGSPAFQPYWLAMMVVILAPLIGQVPAEGPVRPRPPAASAG